MKKIIAVIAAILLTSCDGQENYRWEAVGPTDLAFEGADAKCRAKADAMLQAIPVHRSRSGMTGAERSNIGSATYTNCMAEENWVNVRFQ